MSSTPIAGFHVFKEAWYASSQPDHPAEIMIGLYDPEGGTAGEFAIRWVDLSPRPSPRLEAFDDSWALLLDFERSHALLSGLKEIADQDAPPERVKRLLIGLGFRDLTQRVDEGDYGPGSEEVRRDAEQILQDAVGLFGRVTPLPPRCVQCGGPVEPARHVYVLPTCFACLPPPPPLERLTIHHVDGDPTNDDLDNLEVRTEPHTEPEDEDCLNPWGGDLNS